MKSTQSINRLLLLLILICCCQEIWAKGSKAKNNTTTSNQTTKQPKKVYKIKTTATTTTTSTANPDLETTTLPTIFDLDGRNAFINNKYVSDTEEPTSNNSPALYDALQPQGQTIQTNMAETFQNYDHNSPKIIEVVNDDHIETENLSKKPSLNYGMSQFDEYEEDGTGESDYMPENCEDTQESLGDNNEDIEQDTVADYNIKHEEYLDNSESNMYENKPYDNSEYPPQTYIVRGGSYETDTNQGLTQDLSQNSYGTTKPSQQSNYNKNMADNILGTKSKPGNEQQTQSYYDQIIRKDNQYVQTNPLEHYVQTTQHFYDQSKTQPYLKTHYNMEDSPQPLSNYQKPTQNNNLYNRQPSNSDYSKPGNSFYNKRLQNNTLYNYFNNHTEVLSQLANFNSPNYSDTETPSTFSSTSAQNKKYKTVSSSVQYVSTPLADLVFKYSIGMAKHTKAVQNFTAIKSYVYNVPKNLNGKSE